MQDSYSDEIMFCFVQGFGNGDENVFNKTPDFKERALTETNDNSKEIKKRNGKKVSLHLDFNQDIHEEIDLNTRKSQNTFARKSLRLSSSDKFIKNLPEVKRSLSDRFSIISDGSSRKPTKGLLTIRKTWSTGNFASGAAGGGCGAPRSAPATPLQLEPHPRKHDKHTIKPLSGSAPSVRANVSDTGSVTGDTKEGKQPSKSRQKKFTRHFPQVGPEERVLNYYSCALVGDLLLQGHLYITKNYFAFYSNVFGYVTKLLIPTSTVLRITKEKVARIIPNAVGVCTRDERHVFGSLLSRDSTYKLMTHVWKAARGPELIVPKANELKTSEVELDASEYSPEEDSSSGGADHVDAATTSVRRDSEIIAAAGGATVIQPALLTGASAAVGVSDGRGRSRTSLLLICVAFLLACSATLLAYRLYCAQATPIMWQEGAELSGGELYAELVRWRARLHGHAASELHAFLTTNLLLLNKVRQSLEALSGVILTDMSQADQIS